MKKSPSPSARRAKKRSIAKTARRGSPKTKRAVSLRPPAIGSEWQGGIYAGVARGRDGAPDYYLIVGAEAEDAVTWDGAVEWAASCAPFALPTRKEQALCFANVSELFRAESYWSCEQHASDSDYAWGQDFNYGTQSYWTKGYELRARLVRRLAI